MHIHITLILAFTALMIGGWAVFKDNRITRREAKKAIKENGFRIMYGSTNQEE